MEEFVISKATRIVTDFGNDVLRNAAQILTRDIQMTVTTIQTDNEIDLRVTSALPRTEQFSVAQPDAAYLVVQSGTLRGVMYGALAISKNVLKVNDFWFWLDKLPKKVPQAVVGNPTRLKLPDYRVSYRGWFVNDEVLLNHWQYQESNQNVWQMVYETLLRCGGNIIIPGTGNNAHAHRAIAAAMGLIVTHHHAEPLGAQMFARVYPDLTASYVKHPDLFKSLWQKAIAEQQDSETVWTLGFRGQGDRPFWLDDDHHYTLADRAKVINDVIQTQYRLVKAAVPDAQCAINIYGELTGLYHAGLIKIPQDVIQIWADNGYGKMVSRRQGENDPRTDVLSGQNPNLSQGIYYHVAFHDLQASNFLTLLQIDPHTVAAELDKVHQAGMDDFVLCNTGNIKPSILFLALMAQSWRTDFKVRSTADILTTYVQQYYETNQQKIVALYQRYFTTVFNYGQLADQKAGDEFYTYTLRKIVAAWLAHSQQLTAMTWLTGDKPLQAELDEIADLLHGHVTPFIRLDQQIQTAMASLPTMDANRLYNDLWLSVVVHAAASEALQRTLTAFKAATQPESPNLITAFLQIDAAEQALQRILTAWQSNPLKKWAHFYDNDCYTNISLTIQVLKTLAGYLRITGDGPDEDQWERHYLMTKGDARIMLLSNTHQAYDDHELASRLLAKGIETQKHSKS